MGEKTKNFWIILFHLAQIIFALFTPVAAAGKETNLLKYPVSSVLCIEEKATGFDWENNQWAPKKFVANKKFIAKKIPLDNYKNSAARVNNKLYLCDDPKETKISDENKAFGGFIEACYEIKTVGQEPNPLKSTMCSEYWAEGKLEKISCDKVDSPFFFHPDGLFIKFPWHSNIERNTNYKDSLSISVGSCSRVE